MGQIDKGLGYFKSIPSILKIVQFVILLIAIGCVGYFLDKRSNFDYKIGNLQFFMFVVVVGWLLVIGLFSFFITGLHEKISAVNWCLVVAIISAVWAVLLLISSALVADTARYYDDNGYYNNSWCSYFSKVKADIRCGQLIGGAVCGFVAMILFAIDTILHFRMFMTKSSAPQASAAAVSS